MRPCVLSVYLSSKRSAYITVCVFKNCLMLAGVKSPLLVLLSSTGHTLTGRTHTEPPGSRQGPAVAHIHTSLRRPGGKKNPGSLHIMEFILILQL